MNFAMMSERRSFRSSSLKSRKVSWSWLVLMSITFRISGVTGSEGLLCLWARCALGIVSFLLRIPARDRHRGNLELPGSAQKDLFSPFQFWRETKHSQRRGFIGENELTGAAGNPVSPSFGGNG
jgi:hypothetical protein